MSSKDELVKKKEYRELSTKLIENTNKLMELINQDKALKEKFEQVYDANKYLLDNPTELTKSILSLPNTVLNTSTNQRKSKL